MAFPTSSIHAWSARSRNTRNSLLGRWPMRTSLAQLRAAWPATRGMTHGRWHNGRMAAVLSVDASVSIEAAGPARGASALLRYCTRPRRPSPTITATATSACWLVRTDAHKKLPRPCRTAGTGRSLPLAQVCRRRQWPGARETADATILFRWTATVARGDSAQCRMAGGAPLVCCSTLATSGRNDAPHASPFAERSAPNAVLPLKDGGPLRA